LVGQLPAFLIQKFVLIANFVQDFLLFLLGGGQVFPAIQTVKLMLKSQGGKKQQCWCVFVGNCVLIHYMVLSFDVAQRILSKEKTVREHCQIWQARIGKQWFISLRTLEK